MHKVYYEANREWTEEQYYYLFRYLNRMFLNKNKARDEEILDIDLSKVSKEAQALIVAVLAAQRNLEYIQEFPNLESLYDVRKLKEPLLLSKKPRGLYKEFKALNIHL